MGGTSKAGLGGSRRVRTVGMWFEAGEPSFAVGLVIAAVILSGETGMVCVLDRAAPMNAFGVLYSLGVVAVSALGRVGLALVMSVASAVAFDFFRHRPYAHFDAFQLQNAAVIVIFAVVAVLANRLAALARVNACEVEGRRRELAVLAERQAGLRRAATLVARGADLSDVFAVAAEEMARSVPLCAVATFRYNTDGSAIVVAARFPEGSRSAQVGTRFSVSGTVAATVLRTTRPASVDPREDGIGCVAGISAGDFTSVLCLPIIVNGQVWGATIVGLPRPVPVPTNVEACLGDFVELVAMAIAAAVTRGELIASRARIVAAADSARRRLERDLHDGAQQRLVSLALNLRTAQKLVPAHMVHLSTTMSDLAADLADISERLRELSHGIHPGILSQGGLAPALKTLALQSPVRIDLHVAVDRRLPERVEVAAYYVVAEALTNVAKHANATTVRVFVGADAAYLSLCIADNGVGGADPQQGSGLIGLDDRVQALNGHLRLTSTTSHGTSIHVTIPVCSDERTAGVSGTDVSPDSRQCAGVT